jgi:hypothetical protein
MSDPRVFISFDFDNNKADKDFFAGQAKNSKRLLVLKIGLQKKRYLKKNGKKLSKAK